MDAIEGSRIIGGDARSVLKELPSESVQMCITSPPYWGLRDYGVKGQIGAEGKLEDYINNLAVIFEEVRKILKSDGTFWLNIGDSYTSGGRNWRAPDNKHPARGMSYRPDTPEGLKPKDLIGVPWRVAIKLQENEWYLRSDIIWNKPNAMPESVKDRPTRVHEHVFLFTKSENYLYNYKAIREKSSTGGMKNRRNVWDINTQGYAGAHFAVFPEKLVELCVEAGSNKGDTVLDPFFGSGTVGVVCTKMGRRYIGVELKPEYVRMAKKRISKETRVSQ